MENPPMKELLKKLVELEESQKHLNQELSRIQESAELRQQSHSLAPYRPARRNIGGGAPPSRKSRIPGSMNPSAEKLTDQQYLNILQSVGQSVHTFDLKLRITFWNAMAEKLYGYFAAEVVGQNPINLIVDDRDTAFAMHVTRRCFNGESWTGEFPLKEAIFSSPFLNPGISLPKLKGREGETSSSPAKNSFASKLGLDTKGAVISKLGLDSDQPIQAAIASKMSSLASKVRSKMRAGDTSVTFSEGSHHSEHGIVSGTSSDHMDDAASSGASTPIGDFTHSPFGLFTYDDEKFPLNISENFSDESDGKSAIHKVLTSKAEEWIAKKRFSWPWKGNAEEGSEGRPTHSVWPWAQNEQEKDKSHQINPSSAVMSESHAYESNKPINYEVSTPLSSSINGNSTSSTSTSSCRSTSSSVMNTVDTDSDCVDYEILWDDLRIREQIGQGSCGTVYHGFWCGSDVAVKVFFKQEYSEEVMQSFRQEVSLMKRLRHPNVLLFMGAVTSPQHLSIVSEFLPRGSLFHLLQRSMSKLDWRRHIHMALDIARGMNYLHCCSPPIVHRDLKSSNLLVDRNWTVKVADFGLSRIKHETYLTSKSGKGTPQWMAPEVIRNESADEKSDIYSFGVVLWELATGKIPWDSLNSMRIIGTVGFLNQRLEIPKDIDPCWISLIESCWRSDTKLRPTFHELMEKLRDLKRKYILQSQVTHDAL